VSVPRDLTKIKSKVLLGLTSRQLICFGSAAAIGVPTYFFTRGVLGNSGAVMLMIALMLPAFFVAIYEKDGLPAEKILRNILRSRFFFPTKRPYRTENFYTLIVKEALFARQIHKTGTAETTPVGKRKTGRKK
jgi:hypothetical protein